MLQALAVLNEVQLGGLIGTRDSFHYLDGRERRILAYCCQETSILCLSFLSSLAVKSSPSSGMNLCAPKPAVSHKMTSSHPPPPLHQLSPHLTPTLPIPTPYSHTPPPHTHTRTLFHIPTSHIVQMKN